MLTEPREALARNSTYKLTGSGQIDLTTTYLGSGSDLKTYAIYKVRGNTLTYCVAAPDQPRPTALATRAGDGRTLVVLRRIADS